MSTFGRYGVGGEFKPKPLNGQGEVVVTNASNDGTEIKQPDVPTPSGVGGVAHE